VDDETSNQCQRSKKHSTLNEKTEIGVFEYRGKAIPAGFPPFSLFQ